VVGYSPKGYLESVLWGSHRVGVTLNRGMLGYCGSGASRLLGVRAGLELL